MLQLLLASALTTALPPQAPLTEQKQPPVVAPAPQISTAHVEGEDLFLVDIITSFVPYRVTVKVKEGDKVSDKVVTKYRPVYEVVTRRYDLQELKAYGTNGQRVDPNCLPEMLKKRVPVLISANGQPVDPMYLQAVREGTLTLILPAPDVFREPNNFRRAGQSKE